MAFITIQSPSTIIKNNCHTISAEGESLIIQQYYEFNLKRNLEVDGCPWKENLFGQSALLMNATYVVFPEVVYKFMK